MQDGDGVTPLTSKRSTSTTQHGDILSYPGEHLSCSDSQVAYLLIYGELPSSRELARWDEALMRHSAVPDAVERAVAALPHDAHFMGIVLTAINALSTVHPEQNPALAGQNIYQSKEIQDKQIVRLIGAKQSRSRCGAATQLVSSQNLSASHAAGQPTRYAPAGCMLIWAFSLCGAGCSVVQAARVTPSQCQSYLPWVLVWRGQCQAFSLSGPASNCDDGGDMVFLCLAGKMPAIAALAYHRASGRNISQPNQRLSYSENFLYMLDAANKPGCVAALSWIAVRSGGPGNVSMMPQFSALSAAWPVV